MSDPIKILYWVSAVVFISLVAWAIYVQVTFPSHARAPKREPAREDEADEDEEDEEEEEEEEEEEPAPKKKKKAKKKEAEPEPAKEEKGD